MKLEAYYYDGQSPLSNKGLLFFHQRGLEFKSEKHSFFKDFDYFIFKSDYDYVWFENDDTGERISCDVKHEEHIKKLLPSSTQESMQQFKKAINPSIYFLLFVIFITGIYSLSIKYNFLGVTDLLFSQAEKTLFMCEPKEEFLKLTQRALDVSAKKPEKIKFMISKLPIVNAFAFPGEKIVFTKKALKGLRNEKEFLGVLAHEISHIEFGHTDGTMNVTQVLLSAFGGAVQKAGGLFFNAYSRNREKEADLNAIKILKESNLPSDGLYTFIKKISSSGFKHDGFLEFFSSHPLKSRLVYLKEKTSNKPNRSIFSDDEFNLIKSGQCKDKD